MKHIINWKGIYPAVTTKFTEDDTLDFNWIKKNLNAQVEAGVDGIILGGTLGEASTLAEDEKTGTRKIYRKRIWQKSSDTNKYC